MSTSKLRGNLVSILVGVMGMVIVFLLTGASLHPSEGKYQMEVIVKDRITQIYVMDTATGMVKWVDKMNTPFEQMKGN